MNSDSNSLPPKLQQFAQMKEKGKNKPESRRKSQRREQKKKKKEKEEKPRANLKKINDHEFDDGELCFDVDFMMGSIKQIGKISAQEGLKMDQNLVIDYLEKQTVSLQLNTKIL